MKPEPYDGPTGPADAMDGYTKEFGTLYAKAVDDMLAAIVQFEVATGRIVNQIELERLNVTRIASPAQEHMRHIRMHFLPKPGEVAW